MKRSLNGIVDYKIRDSENNKVKINDFLFDEEGWIVRYLVVDLGNGFTGNKKLIGSQLLNKPEWGIQVLPVRKTKKEISMLPDIEEHLPVSRKYKKLLSNHYQLSNYSKTKQHVNEFAPGPVEANTKKNDEKHIDSRLRSFSEVKEYEAVAGVEMVGEVSNFIVDDKNWQIKYVIIKLTHKILPKHKVVVPVNMVEEISYKKKQITLLLDAEIVGKLPVYTNTLIDKDYETMLYDFFIKGME